MGYSPLKAARLLVYARLKRINTDKGLVRHLRKVPWVRIKLDFKRVHHRTKICRWRARHASLLEQVFHRVADLVASLVPTELLVIDSTPLEDYRDPEARVGFYARGPFKGFKVHLSVNQLGLPLRAAVTPGNRYDGRLMPILLVKSKYVLGDAAYDSKANRLACRAIGAKPLIARNPRRSKRRFRQPELLKHNRYLVEQFNAILKDLLAHCWQRVRGLVRKASLVYSALLAIHCLALRNLRLSKLRTVADYRY